MKLVALEQFRNRLRVGEPLPFAVRDATGQLLLARGVLLDSVEMLERLLARGMFVDLVEVRNASGDSGGELSQEDFFGRWHGLLTRLGAILKAPQEQLFLLRLQECIKTVLALTELNADQLIFSIMRHEHKRYAIYGTSHALHVAAVCSLLARSLGWPLQRQQCLVAAALTANIAIVDLQGRLAARGGPLKQGERELIQRHPLESAQMLHSAGVTDLEWLEAVEQHHEVDGGTGYPAGVVKPSEMSQLLHYVDVFTAKHAGRCGRTAMPAQMAARELYQRSAGHPVPSLLIKEFGIFPPGCFVKLASGEIAIVTRRGPRANQPIACAITNRNGDALTDPAPRDTALAAFSVVSTVVDSDVLVQIPFKKLYKD